MLLIRDQYLWAPQHEQLHGIRFSFKFSLISTLPAKAGWLIRFIFFLFESKFFQPTGLVLLNPSLLLQIIQSKRLNMKERHLTCNCSSWTPILKRRDMKQVWYGQNSTMAFLFLSPCLYSGWTGEHKKSIFFVRFTWPYFTSLSYPVCLKLLQLWISRPFLAPISI